MQFPQNNVTFFTKLSVYIYIGRAYAKVRIFPKIFWKSGPWLCNVAVTLVVRLYSVVITGETFHAPLYRFDFCGVCIWQCCPTLMRHIPVRSHRSFVALFTDACWRAAEVSPNKVEWVSSCLGSDINMCIPGEFTVYVDPEVLGWCDSG